ncbi:ArsB/NhaD family transporter [Campylobacter sp.]|uniref:ArsB/NhaD family transporter n=1 Tax=Campylobacter sp. TaxID=205 RepID=UPI0039C5D210
MYFGSLATLLWLYLLKSKNCKISIKTYLIFSFKITLPVLFSRFLACICGLKCAKKVKF